MHASADDRQLVSISALVAALRREAVPDDAIQRVLAEALGVDAEAAHALLAAPEPADLPTLHARLEAAQKRGDWPAVVALLDRIVEHEPDDRRRAQYYYTRATIQRVELKDLDATIESLDTTLDLNPSLHRAFELLTSIHRDRRDWKSLERAIRKMIHRVRGQADTTLEFNLYVALAEVYRDRLDRPTYAIEAYKVALALRPDDEAVLAAMQALAEQSST